MSVTSSVEAECTGESAGDKPPPGSANVLACPPLDLTVGAKSQDLLAAGQWNNWRWQMRNRIRTLEQLTESFPGIDPASGVAAAAEKFPLAVTPYYASLIRKADGLDPIFRMSVPQAQELYDPPCLKDDPLEEDEDMPVPGLVHRYSDRALLIATTACSTYCRHCTRKRVAGQREASITPENLRQIAAYLRKHTEIRDVILSGGDPLTMSTASLERILATVREIPHIEVVRIGTRPPVVLPMRITEELTAMLRRYHPIWVNTHFNHPRELTLEARAACARLADAGIPVGNQSVLLRGVNDNPRLLEELFRGLVRTRVRPYYLFQCDLVRGVEHFRTPLSRGIEIMEYLRGRLSGLAIPTFVVDAPHGGGKIPILPNYIVSVSPTHTVLRNFEGMLVSYPEPCDLFGSTADAPEAGSTPGVWDLATGGATKIQPARTTRHARRLARCAAPE
jgi:lysine 2,3-aminomutase